jgi:hypothetical protein
LLYKKGKEQVKNGRMNTPRQAPGPIRICPFFSSSFSFPFFFDLFDFVVNILLYFGFGACRPGRLAQGGEGIVWLCI